MLTGGCFCGALRYEAAGEPYHRTVCHCSICRRTTGAPFVAWFTVALGDFRFVAGEPQAIATTATGVRQFCGECGAQITFRNTVLDEIDVTTASLDDPALAPPEDHTWVSSKLSFIELCDGLPQHAQARS